MLSIHFHVYFIFWVLEYLTFSVPPRIECNGATRWLSCCRVLQSAAGINTQTFHQTRHQLPPYTRDTKHHQNFTKQKIVISCYSLPWSCGHERGGCSKYNNDQHRLGRGTQILKSSALYSIETCFNWKALNMFVYVYFQKLALLCSEARLFFLKVKEFHFGSLLNSVSGCAYHQLHQCTMSHISDHHRIHN